MQDALFSPARLRDVLDLDPLVACHSFLWGGVSPVLLSLCLVSLANQGYGTKTGILSILLASGTVDNIVVIVIFDMLRESMRLSGSSPSHTGRIRTTPCTNALRFRQPGSEGALVFGRIAMKVLLSVSAGCALGLVLACLPNRYSVSVCTARACSRRPGVAQASPRRRPGFAQASLP